MTEHVPDALRLQLVPAMIPNTDGPLNWTNAAGMKDGATVSITVIVHAVEVPNETVDGEQMMVVEVGS